MSTKDFKQGMVAGAKPFGDKLDQLANVSESAVNDIQEGLDGVTEVVNIVLDDLSAQEKKRIYDLDQITDISSLEDDEKEFLVAVLTELANTISYVSDLQKKYLLSICSVANIPAPQTSLNLAFIENVENMKTQKILLRHVMEFLFIGDQNYDFLENYEDGLFCYFSVNKRGIAEIKECINRVYNAMGIEGIANRYTFAANYQELCFEQETNEYDEEDITDDEPIEENEVSKEEIDKLEQEAERLYLEFKIAEALEIFNRLVELKHPRAMYFASEIYSKGYNATEIDKDKAFQLRKNGAERGDYLCALNYAFTISDAQERQSAVQKLMPDVTKAAQSGDIFAQYEMASLYHQGTSVEKNTDMALMWLNRSSDLWLSKYALGYYYFAGIAGDKNLEKAIEMWGAVAQLGYPKACHNYYRAISGKLKTSQEEKIRANQYLHKAANAKLSSSLYSLAEMYYESPTYTPDQKAEFKEKAIIALRQAAELGHKDAIKKLNRLEAGKKISIFSWESPYYTW